MKSKLTYFLRNPLRLFVVLFTKPFPYFGFLYKTEGYINRVNFSFWFKQKVLNFGGNKSAYWPVHWTSTVHDADKIVVGVDSSPGINGGAYITGTGGLEIGDYCLFAKNIVIVTANHDISDFRKRTGQPVKMGNYCWMGAGAKIMPGVELGEYTIVAAGAVVTKSFPEGYCIIGGVPAKKLKDLDPAQCTRYEHQKKYVGYLRKDVFERKKKRKLSVSDS